MKWMSNASMKSFCYITIYMKENHIPHHTASLGCKLLRTATIVRILSKQNRSLSGINPEVILKVFILLMARSTWIRTAAIRLDLLTAFLLSLLPWLNAGIFKVHFFGRSRWRMLNPLSAMTSSLSDSLSRNPLFSVIWTSLMHPEYTLDRNVIAPVGMIPTNNLNAFKCL